MMRSEFFCCLSQFSLGHSLVLSICFIVSLVDVAELPEYTFFVNEVEFVLVQLVLNLSFFLWFQILLALGKQYIALLASHGSGVPQVHRLEVLIQITDWFLVNCRGWSSLFWDGILLYDLRNLIILDDKRVLSDQRLVGEMHAKLLFRLLDSLSLRWLNPSSFFYSWTSDFALCFWLLAPLQVALFRYYHLRTLWIFILLKNLNASQQRSLMVSFKALDSFVAASTSCQVGVVQPTPCSFKGIGVASRWWMQSPNFEAPSSLTACERFVVRNLLIW